jgi:hypothetical protein
MKKSQKWLLTLITVIPAIIVIAFFVISDINIKELPWWVIVIPILIIASPFTFFLSQRAYNTTLQKRKKRLLINFGTLILLLVITIILTHFHVIYQFMWIPISVMLLTPMFFMFFYNFRLFFPKEKKEYTKDESV